MSNETCLEEQWELEACRAGCIRGMLQIESKGNYMLRANIQKPRAQYNQKFGKPGIERYCLKAPLVTFANQPKRTPTSCYSP